MLVPFKARIHTGLTFSESVLESADSSPKSADSTIDFVIVGRLPDIFNISTPIQSADSSQLTIAVGGLQIGLVGMGLKLNL